MVGGLLVQAMGQFALGLEDYIPVPYVDYIPSCLHTVLVSCHLPKITAFVEHSAHLVWSRFLDNLE